MPLNTQCGRCGRRFAVYAQGLREHRGRVECPQCGHRFDGLAALLDEPTGESPGEPADEALEEPAGEPRRDLGASLARTRLGLGTQEPGPEPPKGGNPLATLAGWTLALLLVVGLVMQLLWWNRADLLRDPATHGVVEGLCQGLGCEIPPIRLPGALTLLDPSLSPGPEPEALTLCLKIQNQSELPQPLPVLELELLGPQGDLEAVRRFDPAEYASDAPRQMETQQTLEVRLSLVKPGLPPEGFRVRLL